MLDRVMAGDPGPVETVSLADVRLGVPRAYYYENLETGLADVVESTLDRLAASCKSLVEVDLDGVGELNQEVSFPWCCTRPGAIWCSTCRVCAGYIHRGHAW